MRGCLTSGNRWRGTCCICPMTTRRRLIPPQETDPSERRRSRESPRSADFIRRSMELPQRVRLQIRRGPRGVVWREAHHAETQSDPSEPEIAVSVRYLLISPVLLPFSQTLLPPAPLTSVFTARGESGEGGIPGPLLKHPTLAVFGSKDGFTSGRHLGGWARTQASLSRSSFEWEQIEGAGHFWRESGTVDALNDRIARWLRRNDDAP